MVGTVCNCDSQIISDTQFFKVYGVNNSRSPDYYSCHYTERVPRATLIQASSAKMHYCQACATYSGLVLLSFFPCAVRDLYWSKT